MKDIGRETDISFAKSQSGQRGQQSSHICVGKMCNIVPSWKLIYNSKRSFIQFYDRKIISYDLNFH